MRCTSPGRTRAVGDGPSDWMNWLLTEAGVVTTAVAVADIELDDETRKQLDAAA